MDAAGVDRHAPTFSENIILPIFFYVVFSEMITFVRRNPPGLTQFRITGRPFQEEEKIRPKDEFCFDFENSSFGQKEEKIHPLKIRP